MDKNEYQRIRAYLKSKGETPEMIKATMDDITSGRTKASSLKIPKDFSHEAKVIKPATRVKRVKSDLEDSYDPKTDNVGGDALEAEDVPEEKPKATPVKKKVDAPAVQPKATKGVVVTPKQERVASTGMKSQDVTQAAPTPRKTQSTKQALALDSQAIIQNEDDKLKTKERAKQGRTRVIKNKSKPMGVDADYWKGLDANQQDELIRGRKAIAVNAPGTPVPSTLEELRQNPNAIKVGEAGSKSKTHRGATPEAPVEAPAETPKETPKKATVRKVDSRNPLDGDIPAQTEEAKQYQAQQEVARKSQTARQVDAPKVTAPDDDGFTERYNQRRKAGQSHASATEGARRDVAKATAPRPAPRAPAATPEVDAPEVPRASPVTPDAPEAPRAAPEAPRAAPSAAPRAAPSAAPEAPRAAPSAAPSAASKVPPKVGPVGATAAAAANDAIIPDAPAKGILGKAKSLGGTFLKGAGWVGAGLAADEIIPGGLVDAPSNFLAAYDDNESRGLNAPIPHSWSDVGSALLDRNWTKTPPVDKPNPAGVVRNNMGVSAGMVVEPPLLDVPRTKDDPQAFFKTTGQQVPLTEDNTNFKFSPELLVKSNADKAAGAMNQQPVVPAIVGNAQGQAKDLENTKNDWWDNVTRAPRMAYENIAAGMQNNFQAGVHMAQDPALEDAPPPQKPTPEQIVAQNPQAAQQKVQQNIAAGIQSGDLSTPKLAQEVAKAENPNASPKQLEQYARQEVAAMRDMNTEEKSNYVAYAMIAAGLLAAALDDSGAAGDAFGDSYNRQLDRNTLLANKKMEQDAANQAAFAQALKDQRELDYKYYNTDTVAGTAAATEASRNLRSQASDKAKILAAQIRAGGDAAGALKGAPLSIKDALDTAAILHPDAPPEIQQQIARNLQFGSYNAQSNVAGTALNGITVTPTRGFWGGEGEGTPQYTLAQPPRLQ